MADEGDDDAKGSVEKYVDDKSTEKVDKYEDGTPKDDDGDTWANLVAHLTGYPMPKRSTLFEKLTSDHGGPLFRMDFQDHDVAEVLKSGFEVNSGEDYDIWFFTGPGNARLKQARIVFEGTAQDKDGHIIWADTSGKTAADIKAGVGGEFTDYNKDTMNNEDLFRYMNGPRTALLDLFGGGTTHTSFGGRSVPDASAVDLKTFDATGDSFDRAAKFFKDYATIIKGWEDALGKDDAVWKGESADIFRSLLTKTRENYEAYIDTFNGSGDQAGQGQTVYSRALSQAKVALQLAAQRLLDAWQKWAQSDYYEPIRVLGYVLDDLARWVEDNNVKKTKVYASTTYSGTWYYARTEDGFTQNHPKYGDLADKASWKKVGEEAVRIWNRAVDEYLVKPAATVQSDLNNTFLDLGRQFTDHIPKPKTTSTAATDYDKKKTEEENKRIEDENKKLKDEYEQDKKDAEAKEKEAQDKADEESKKLQDALDKLGDANNDQAEHLQDALDKLGDANGDQTEHLQDALDKLGDTNGAGAGADGGTVPTLPRTELALDNLGSGGDGGLGADGTTVPTTTSLGTLDGLNGSAGAGADGGTVPTLPRTELALDTPGGDGNGGGRLGTDSTFMPTTTSLGALDGLNGGNTRTANQKQDTDALRRTLLPLGDAPTGIRTPTGGLTSLSGGDFATAFPDGSSSSFDPRTGMLTSVDPTGLTSATDLTHGAAVSNPDGSVTRLENGRLTTRFPDGSKQVVDPDTGIATMTDPAGRTTTTDLGSLQGLNDNARSDSDLHGSGAPGDLGDLRDRVVTQSLGDLGNLTGLDHHGATGLPTPTGGHLALHGGDFATTYPDGSSTSFDPDTGMLTSVGPNGRTIATDLTHGASVTNPDGSTTSLDHGQLTTRFPDGSKQVVDPDTRIATTTDPRGHTTTTDLRGLGGFDGLDDSGSTVPDSLTDRVVTLPTSGSGGDTGMSGTKDLGTLRDLNVPPSLGSPGGSASGGSGGSVALGGMDTARATTLGDIGSAGTAGTDSGSGAANVSGPPAASGQATGSPGMPMMPMSGMGTGGDKGSHTERVRAVLTDSLEESRRRTGTARRGHWGGDDEDDTFLAPVSRPATTSGRAGEETPGTAAQVRTAGGSSYQVDDDTDVWGTDEGGAPAVIGR
ncbi:AAWKG family protein [Streptomyces mexicanus]|uniref:AAWKG family protein n=1 Tax=Streptomyces mexicanus TaxID=178566 RepID=UPI0036BEDD0F